MSVKGREILVVLSDSREATILLCIHNTLQQNERAESAGGRQFAMMAAQGLDLLWSILLLSVIFLNFCVYGSDNGK